MATEVKRTAETLLVTDAALLVVGEVVQLDGRFLRSFRIYSTNTAVNLPVIEVVADAATADALKITIPEVEL